MLTLLVSVALACPEGFCEPVGTHLVDSPTVDGQPHGVWRATFADGSPAWEATFCDGQKCGVERQWFGAYSRQPGHLALERTWVDGTLHGPERTWTPHDGERGDHDVTTGRYAHGRRVGTWRARVEDGRPISVRHFVDGQEHGVSRFWEVGALMSKERWDRGRLTHTWDAWGDGWEPLSQ